MPSERELNQVFGSIVENGLEFIEASVGELGERPTFSVVHFAAGLELLLKARLFREHWTLVGAKPHEMTWLDLRQGDAITLRASALCRTLENVTGTRLKLHKSVFQAVFTHRNRVMHFVHTGESEEIAAEQLRAWFHLQRLITGPWAAVFGEHVRRINSVERALLGNRQYLQTKFDQAANRLREARKQGSVFKCPSCGFDAVVLEHTDSPVSRSTCAVCEEPLTSVDFGCGHWHIVRDESNTFECECGEQHEMGDLVDKLDACADLSPKEQHIEGPGRYHCGECFSADPRVVPVDDGEAYVCLSCGARFQDSHPSSCGWCNELWVGYDTEGSYFTGCEFCDGHDPD